MNESGLAVASVQRFYRIEPEHIVVVHDDVDLDVGRVRIRSGGRAGGNRGVASIIEVLGDPGFLRLKVGVGRPPAGPVPPDYVLSVPPAEEGGGLEEGGARGGGAGGGLPAARPRPAQ